MKCFGHEKADNFTAFRVCLVKTIRKISAVGLRIWNTGKRSVGKHDERMQTRRWRW